MLTLGIDLAGSPEDTAVCWVSWNAKKAVVDEIRHNAEDPTLLLAINQSEKVGIDVPLGWPDEFVEAITVYQTGGRWPNHPRAALRYRETDRCVKRLTGRPLLSVSSDRIAVPAMRAAAVLANLSPCVDRTGAGKIVEVYPVVALHQWDLGHRHYKGPKRDKERKELVNLFAMRTARWLQSSQQWQSACENSDHAFDALLSALVARTKVQGLCVPIPPQAMLRASREGWIAIPTQGSLEGLI